MLNSHKSVNVVEADAAHLLQALLEEVPAISHPLVESGIAHDRGVDLLARFELAGVPRTFVVEVKSSGQPRHVRTALLQLKAYLADHPGAIPVFMAPYLSDEARSICKHAGVNYLDFEGNAWIAFDSVLIDRRLGRTSPAERRDLKSLFKPKSARVLRVLLRDPKKSWKVVDLANEAGVSVGHASNVRTALREREWADVSEHGVYLSKPGALLDDWAGEYKSLPGRRVEFYTVLHGSEFDNALRRLGARSGESGRYALASYSAAQWIAPYARNSNHYFYADERGAELLKTSLNLASASKGGNVIITILDDPEELKDAIDVAPGIRSMGVVQTYLDLTASGERGKEAAEFLRKNKMGWD